jgi:TFIIF-interacting CTD phosphatase-like protein
MATSSIFHFFYSYILIPFIETVLYSIGVYWIQKINITSNPSRKEFKLPKKTLVLDLDETLVHSSTRGIRHDFMVEVLNENASLIYYVYKRPHLDYFLKKVAQWYDIVIFTASVSEYGKFREIRVSFISKNANI